MSVLSYATRASREADEIRQAIEQRLAGHRAQLERDIDHDTTTLLRGRIREAKELLALLAAAPATVPAPLDAAGFVGHAPVPPDMPHGSY